MVAAPPGAINRGRSILFSLCTGPQRARACFSDDALSLFFSPALSLTLFSLSLLSLSLFSLSLFSLSLFSLSHVRPSAAGRGADRDSRSSRVHYLSTRRAGLSPAKSHLDAETVRGERVGRESLIRRGTTTAVAAALW